MPGWGRVLSCIGLPGGPPQGPVKVGGKWSLSEPLWNLWIARPGEGKGPCSGHFPCLSPQARVWEVERPSLRTGHAFHRRAVGPFTKPNKLHTTNSDVFLGATCNGLYKPMHLV